MLLNCDPSLIGDPLLGCRGKFIACQTPPKITVPFAEPCRPITTKEKWVDFKWKYHVMVKEKYDEYFGSEDDDLATEIKMRENLSKPVKLRRVQVGFDNMYGFPSMDSGSSAADGKGKKKGKQGGVLEEDYDMVHDDEIGEGKEEGGGGGSGGSGGSKGSEEDPNMRMDYLFNLKFKEKLNESEGKGQENAKEITTKEPPPTNIGEIEDHNEDPCQFIADDEPISPPLPRQRIRPTLPTNPIIEVKLKIGYRNDTAWQNNRPFAIVQIIEPDPFKEAIKANPQFSHDPAFRETHKQHLHRQSLGLDKKNILMKWYKPYTITVGRPPRTTEECHVDVSPFQAETAAYVTAQQAGLQGNVVPYHLGFFVLAEHRRTQGLRDVITEFTDDQVGESWRKYGVFALFELVPGRSLDMFHVVGKNPTLLRRDDGGLMEGIEESLDDPQWINENIATSVRREFDIPDATFASITALHRAGIGYNNIRGRDVTVYPKITKNSTIDHTGKTITTTAHTEYVAVLTGFENATTTAVEQGDIRVAFAQDVLRMDELAQYWEETGEVPDVEEEDEEYEEEEPWKGDPMLTGKF